VYRLLLDERVKHLKPAFPRKRAIMTTEAGLDPDASDSRIVQLAWEREYIIVTANGIDFEREIRFPLHLLKPLGGRASLRAGQIGINAAIEPMSCP
jgi:Domain of unknown function (DUF5615)